MQKECKLSDHQVQGVPSKNEVGILLFKSGTSGALDNINVDEKRKSREQWFISHDPANTMTHKQQAWVRFGETSMMGMVSSTSAPL